MKYKLKYNLPHDAATCLGWLLDARGVEDIEGYVYPSKDYELNPHLLDNIDRGANLLKKHLDNDSNILLVQDCDTDGIMSSAMLWLYVCVNTLFYGAVLNRFLKKNKKNMEFS